MDRSWLQYVASKFVDDNIPRCRQYGCNWSTLAPYDALDWFESMIILTCPFSCCGCKLLHLIVYYSVLITSLCCSSHWPKYLYSLELCHPCTILDLRECTDTFSNSMYQSFIPHQVQVHKLHRWAMRDTQTLKRCQILWFLPPEYIFADRIICTCIPVGS